MKRVERIRLYPTPSQVERVHFMLDVTRELYNALLQERRDAYRMRRVTVTTKQQYAEITALRKPIERIDGRLAAVYRECEDAVLHRLDLAYRAFFRRIKAGETAGHPRFKAATRWKQLEFPHGNRALKFDAEQKCLFVPGVGNVRVRKGRQVPAFGRAWITERNGRLYACFECERDAEPLAATGKIVGVDRGVHVLAATSDGVLHHNPEPACRWHSKVSRHQRAMEAATVRDAAGRVQNRHSRERQQALARLRRAKEREANARRDALHKLGRMIVRGADAIGIEALNVRAMTRSAKGTAERPGRNVRAKAGLNRAMLDASFGLLRQMIVAKAESAGRTVVEVDARFSSQECSRCGRVAAENRRGRRFACVACGFRTHADVNAALVIRRRAQLALKSEPDPGEEPGGRARCAA